MMVSPPAAPGPGEEAGVAVALASGAAVGEETGVWLDAGMGVEVGVAVAASCS